MQTDDLYLWPLLPSFVLRAHVCKYPLWKEELSLLFFSFCFVLFCFVLFCFVLFGLVWFGVNLFILVLTFRDILHLRTCCALGPSLSISVQFGTFILSSVFLASSSHRLRYSSSPPCHPLSPLIILCSDSLPQWEQMSRASFRITDNVPNWRAFYLLYPLPLPLSLPLPLLPLLPLSCFFFFFFFSLLLCIYLLLLCTDKSPTTFTLRMIEQ